MLHSFTWDLSEDISLSFAERLKHKAAYFCQDCAVFDCLRRRDELVNMLMGEFTVLPDQKNIKKVLEDAGENQPEGRRPEGWFSPASDGTFGGF